MVDELLSALASDMMTEPHEQTALLLIKLADELLSMVGAECVNRQHLLVSACREAERALLKSKDTNLRHAALSVLVVVTRQAGAAGISNPCWSSNASKLALDALEDDADRVQEQAAKFIHNVRAHGQINGHLSPHVFFTENNTALTSWAVPVSQLTHHPQNLRKMALRILLDSVVITQRFTPDVLGAGFACVREENPDEIRMLGTSLLAYIAQTTACIENSEILVKICDQVLLFTEPGNPPSLRLVAITELNCISADTAKVGHLIQALDASRVISSIAASLQSVELAPVALSLMEKLCRANNVFGRKVSPQAVRNVVDAALAVAKGENVMILCENAVGVLHSVCFYWPTYIHDLDAVVDIMVLVLRNPNFSDNGRITSFGLLGNMATDVTLLSNETDESSANFRSVTLTNTKTSLILSNARKAILKRLEEIVALAEATLSAGMLTTSLPEEKRIRGDLTTQAQVSEQLQLAALAVLQNLARISVARKILTHAGTTTGSIVFTTARFGATPAIRVHSWALFVNLTFDGDLPQCLARPADIVEAAANVVCPREADRAIRIMALKVLVHLAPKNAARIRDVPKLVDALFRLAQSDDGMSGGEEAAVVEKLIERLELRFVGTIIVYDRAE